MNLIKYLINQLIFFYCFVLFYVSKKNTSLGHRAMISTFSLDGGRTLDIYSWILSKLGKTSCAHRVSGIFGNLTTNDIELIVGEIKRDGFFKSSVMLPEVICSKIDAIVLNEDAYPFRNSPKDAPPLPQKINFEKPTSARYGFACCDVIKYDVIQELMADETMIAIASKYLGVSPILDSVQLSASTTFSKMPNEDAAQMYHFDMDRLKWLKFFIYLDDVDQTNGAHTFIKGSHITKGIPKILLMKGYQRHRDSEVECLYSKDQIVEFTGKRGTIFVEDTRGLHKGKVLLTGKRVVLQFQYNNSNFGDLSPKGFAVPCPINPLLENMLAKNRNVYQNFIYER